MLRLASLGSGSKGNATLIASKDTVLLIDCGFPVREMMARLPRLGLEVTDIDAVLVTHEHSDHIAGVPALAKAASAPVYTTYGTRQSGKLDSARSVVEIESDSSFAIGDIEVRAVTVPHDARQPVQYRFFHNGVAVGVLTDLGCVSPHVQAAFSGCDMLLLEFNHDLEMLRRGPYPAALKRRVAGDFGHLNNEQAMTMLASMTDGAPKVIVAGHISEQNNSIEAVSSRLEAWSRQVEAQVLYATQSQGFDWISPDSASLSVNVA